jgi:hypothetical protein
VWGRTARLRSLHCDRFAGATLRYSEECHILYTGTYSEYSSYP